MAENLLLCLVKGKLNTLAMSKSSAMQPQPNRNSAPPPTVNALTGVPPPPPLPHHVAAPAHVDQYDDLLGAYAVNVCP